MPRKQIKRLPRADIQKNLGVTDGEWDELVAAGVIIVLPEVRGYKKDGIDRYDLEFTRQAYLEYKAQGVVDITALKARALASELRQKISKSELLDLELLEKRATQCRCERRKRRRRIWYTGRSRSQRV